MALGIFQKVSAVPQMANIANNITRSPDHILICSYKSIFWGDTFKGRIKNHIKPIRLLNMVCGGVIWQDKGGNNVVLLLCQSQRRYCHAVKIPVIANIEDFCSL